jgi:hypothetical protein
MSKLKYIIIGGGISGLYTLHKIVVKYDLLPHEIKILETNKKIGGRIHKDTFQKKRVIVGAGIGRLDKDKLLKQLLQEFDIKYKIYKTSINYTFPEINILEIVNDLRKWCDDNLTNEMREIYNFEDLFKIVYNEYLFNKFKYSSGHTDYLKADIIDTLHDYGFEDNVGGYDAMSINWDELLDSIYSKYKKYIITNITVDSVKNNKIKCTKNKRIKNLEKIYLGKVIKDKQKKKSEKVFYSEKIIFACPTNIIEKIYKNKKYSSLILKNIICQPFVRAYVISKEDLGYKTFTFTDTYLQKVIPLSSSLYMISYSDNDNAKIIKDIFKNNINKDIILYYWNCGTHYFYPLNKIWNNRNQFLVYAQNPENNIYCVGEAFSKNQGWVEGALESVEKITIHL